MRLRSSGSLFIKLLKMCYGYTNVNRNIHQTAILIDENSLREIFTLTTAYDTKSSINPVTP